MMNIFSAQTTAFVMPFGSSSGELGLVLFVFLLLFGAKKLPEMARTVGRFMEHLRRASNEFRGQLVEADKVVAETRREFDDVSRDLALDDASRDEGWSDPYASGDGGEDDAWGDIDYDDANLEPDAAPEPASDAAPADAPPESADDPPDEEPRGT